MSNFWIHRFHPLKTAKGLENWLIRRRVPVVVPRIVRTLEHDQGAFTQGLAYRDGIIYESTGHNNSSLRALNAADGKLLKVVPVEGDFAEGIAVWGNRLYQLSWKSGQARVYVLPELEKLGEVHYDGEGWGLTAGPAGLIMSDGTSRLRVRDNHFAVLQEIVVRSNLLPVRKINDLEWCDGLIYANIFKTAELFEISYPQGKLLRIVDCRELTAAAAEHSESVLNGVAYCRESGTFFVTGKNWNQIFELEIPR